MVTKNDCLVLLSLDETEEAKILLESVLVEDKIPDDVIKYLSKMGLLDITRFYEKLRASYNQKKSKLYINLLRQHEDPHTSLTTLSSYIQQVTLYLQTVDNKEMFLKNTRLAECCTALAIYAQDIDLQPVLDMLTTIKEDVKNLESSYRKIK